MIKGLQLIRRNKYGPKRTNHAGYSFASKAESELFDLLKLQEKAGEIKDIKCQQHVKLTKAQIVYIADFSAIDCSTNEKVWYEYKGFSTDVWRLKRRLYMHYGPGPLKVYKKRGKTIYLEETICPRN